MKRKVLLKNILISLLCLLLLGLCVLTAYTFSYFSDKKEQEINVTISNASGSSLQVQSNLNTSELIADNTFTKNVTLTNTANFNYYVRFYAFTLSEVYVNNVKTSRTDVVELTNVASSGNLEKNNTDNKFYYKSVSSPTAITTSVNTVNLVFTFHVISSINESSYAYYNGVSYQKDSTLKTTITYYAEYVKADSESYSEWESQVSALSVNFKNDDNSNIETRLYAYGDLITSAPTPTKAGYEFVGWSVGGELIDLETYRVSNNVSLVAVFRAPARTVTFKVDDVVYATQSVEVGGYATEPTAPVKDGLSFVGWSLNGSSEVDLSTYAITQNKEFTAVFGDAYLMTNWLRYVTSSLSISEITSITFSDTPTGTFIANVGSRTKTCEERSGIIKAYNAGGEAFIW